MGKTFNRQLLSMRKLEDVLKPLLSLFLEYVIRRNAQIRTSNVPDIQMDSDGFRFFNAPGFDSRVQLKYLKTVKWILYRQTNRCTKYNVRSRNLLYI